MPSASSSPSTPRERPRLTESPRADGIRARLDAAPFGPGLDEELRDSRYAQVRAPLLSLSFSDDPIATPAAVEALLASYPNAQIERRWIRPREAGVRHIGHHGFFSERHRDSLWRAALDWIDARCA